MTQRFGIDTSVLVRLLTGDPEPEFVRCVRRLTALAGEGAEIFASNQVIGEAYIAVQHHYGVSKTEVRSALSQVLQSGLIVPLNGYTVLAALESNVDPGLLDRLIVNDYTRAELETLTLDQKMAGLPNANHL